MLQLNPSVVSNALDMGGLREDELDDIVGELKISVERRKKLEEEIDHLRMILDNASDNGLFVS